jgi:hypothetical protein
LKKPGKFWGTLNRTNLLCLLSPASHGDAGSL